MSRRDLHQVEAPSLAGIFDQISENCGWRAQRARNQGFEWRAEDSKLVRTLSSQTASNVTGSGWQ